PIPDGEGWAGFIDGTQSNNAYKEYIGACLTDPMTAGTSYTLNMWIAWADGEPNIDLTIFGTPNCADLPWLGMACPVGSGDWAELTSTSVSFSSCGEWQNVILTFTPSVDINSICIGGPCPPSAVPPGDTYNYYYVDGLTLVSTANGTITASGGWCSGDLTLTSFMDTTGYTCQWYQDGIALIGETTEILDVMPYGTGVFTVVYTIGSECEAISYTVTIPDEPVADFTWTDQCEGLGAMDFTDASTISSGTITAWDWDFGDGGTSTLTNPSNTYSAAGTYSVTLTVTSSDGCTNSVSYPVTIFPNPTPDFEFAIDGASSSSGATGGCLGNPVDFTNLSTILAPDIITSTAWDFGEGGTSGASDPSYTYGAVGTYSVTLTITSNNGCIDSITIPLEIFPIPVPSFIVNDVCDGDSATFVDASTISSGSITGWEWDFDDGSPADFTPAPGPSHTYSAGTYNPTLIVTSDQGCQNSVTVPITVFSLPVVTAGPDQTMCDGAACTLTGGGASIYAWTGGVTDGTPFVPTVGTTTYTVTGTDINGCVSTDDVDVIVNPLPLVTAGVDQTVCNGENVTLSGGGASTYSWTGGITDGLPFSPSLGTTTYTVTGTDANGCISTDDVDVIVNPLPIISAGPDQSVCDGDNVTLTASGGITYVWTGGVSDGVPFIPAVGPNNYTVTGTDANGCMNLDDVDVLVNPLDDPTFNYPAGLTHCITGTDPSASVTGLSGGTFTYTVTSGGPLLDIDVSTGNITLSGSNVGSYEITYSTAGAAGSLCPQSMTVVLTITDAPIADFIIDDVCANGVDPIPTFTGGGTAGVFTATPAGLVLDPSSGEVDLGASTPGTYTVTNTIDIPACATAISTDDITIFEVPTVTLSGSATICPGDIAPDLVVDVFGGTAPYIVDYTFNGSAQPPLLLAGIAGLIDDTETGVYEITSIVDANGCSADISGEIEIIDEYPLPVMDLLSDQEVCAEDALVINLFSSSLAGDTYDWTNVTGIDLGFGLSGAGQIGSFTGSNGGVIDITVTVEITPTSADGCEGLPVSFDITIHPIPDPSLTPDITQGCVPLTVQFTEIVGGAESSECIWNFGDGTTATGCGGVSHTYTSEGLFDVSLSVTTADGCSAEFTANELIYVTPMPIASFDFNPEVITVENTEVQFENHSINADSYSWEFSDGSPINNETNPTHSFPEIPGSYMVTLTATNSGGECVDVYQQLLVIEDVIVFYVPNVFTPDGDSYNETFKPIFTSGYDPYDYHLTLFNRWGEIIFESFNSEVGWDGTYGTKGLVADAVYVWQIEYGDTMSDKKYIHRGHVTVLK
ncbi:PKD domain-containing protein, partial [Crocinitomix catalasitica]|nr:PKD domain-containing protein [Crocinitomix catalasitica]